MSVRDELVEIIDGHVREIFTVVEIADAILARFPWIAEEHVVQHGSYEAKSARSFDPEWDHVWEQVKPGNVTRYVTPWRKTA